jgi:hypothetical protein
MVRGFSLDVMPSMSWMVLGSFIVCWMFFCPVGLLKTEGLTRIDTDETD